MKTLDYSPQTTTVDEMGGVVDSNRAFLVNDDGTLELSGNWCPEVRGHQGHADPDVNESGWEFFSRGYTGQDRYNGPEMHDSECLAGRLASDILATPGEYALCEVYYPCDGDCEQCEDFSDPDNCNGGTYESWVVLKKTA